MDNIPKTERMDRKIECLPMVILRGKVHLATDRGIYVENGSGGYEHLTTERFNKRMGIKHEKY